MGFQDRHEAINVTWQAPLKAAGLHSGSLFLRLIGGLVPEVGLEPTLAEANTALNRARLPIPPLRQRNSLT